MNHVPEQVFAENQGYMRYLLEELVQIESPSTEKAAVDQLGRRVAEEIAALGGQIERVPSTDSGDKIVARWGAGPGGILFLCHMDTVFDLGTTAGRPFREEGDKYFGPGVLDMKSGIVILLGAMRAMQKSSLWTARPLTALFTADEETGSLHSRETIEKEASQAAVVFCMEPALPDGALKTARKGTGKITLLAKGHSTHAGADHERGRNAIVELAHHVITAQALTDYPSGTTVNVGVIRGGTRTNVVPDRAEAWLDFRVAVPGEVERLQRWADQVRPVIQGAEITVQLSVNRPPMPRDETMALAFEKAQRISREVGQDLKEGRTGGASDANFVAPLGVPVLDGLGAVGEGAHSDREFIFARSLIERAALLSALILNW